MLYYNKIRMKQQSLTGIRKAPMHQTGTIQCQLTKKKLKKKKKLSHLKHPSLTSFQES